MNILVMGGTRFMGVHLVKALIKDGHQITIATRGKVKAPFEDRVKQIIVDRSNQEEMSEIFRGQSYDVVCDNIAYCSNDVRNLLNVIECGRYILTSSASVYPELGMNTVEEAFDPLQHSLVWCERDAYPYDEIKRQAECALFQKFSGIPAAAVRFPYVLGEDDYTKRLYFYVEHIIKGVPMHVDNPEAETAFINSREAGEFLAWLTTKELTGPVNASSKGTATLQEIFDYIERRTGKKPILAKEAQAAPYNEGEAFSLNTGRAEESGYHFPELKDWLYQLLDKYIAEISGFDED